MLAVEKIIIILTCFLFSFAAFLALNFLNLFPVWVNLITVVGIFIAVLALYLIAAVIQSNKEYKDSQKEQQHLKEVSERINFKVDDLTTAKHLTRGYLIEHPGSTTEQLQENLALPAAFYTPKKENVVEALTVAGFTGVYRYGMDSETGKWFTIHDNKHVLKRYHEYQREHIKGHQP